MKEERAVIRGGGDVDREARQEGARIARRGERGERVVGGLSRTEDDLELHPARHRFDRVDVEIGERRPADEDRRDSDRHRGVRIHLLDDDDVASGILHP